MRRSLLGLALAAVFSAFAAAPAAANRAYGAFKPFSDLLTFEVSDSGRELRAATMRVVLDCGDGYVTEWAATFTISRRAPRPGARNRNVLVIERAAAGRLRARIVARWGTASDYRDYTGRLELWALKDRSARVRVTLDAVDSGVDGDHCRARLTLRAQREPGVLYVGATNDDEPVWVRRQGNSVEWLSGFGADCKPKGFMEGIHTNALAMAEATAFGWPDLVDGFQYLGYDKPFSLSVQIAGRFSGERASGTARFLGAGGPRDADSCDTGALTWRAHSS
jgi:hypothetical protein